MNMCQDIEVEIFWKIRSGWKAFATIRDVLKAKPDNISIASIAPFCLGRYSQAKTWVNTKEE